MESTKLATLIATSLVTVLNVENANAQPQHNDLSICESVSSFKEMKTCQQCNGPTFPKPKGSK